VYVETIQAGRGIEKEKKKGLPMGMIIIGCRTSASDANLSGSPAIRRESKIEGPDLSPTRTHPTLGSISQ